MNTQTTHSATPKELLLERLYAELKANPTGTDEFEAAFKYIKQLDADEKDPELVELEREAMRVKIQRERASAHREDTDAHIAEREANARLHAPKIPFFERHADALITAAAGIVGVALVVGAEQLGNQILNSKALKMPTMKF